MILDAKEHEFNDLKKKEFKLLCFLAPENHCILEVAMSDFKYIE